MLTPDDELPHRPPDPLPERWQENYFILGLDEDHGATFAVHLERFPAEGTVEAKVDVAVGDEVVSSTSAHPLGDKPGGGATTVDVVEPFRRWRLRHDGSGRAGRGPQGFVGHGAGDVAALGIDVELHSPLGGIDHAALLRALAMPGTERDHYEACGTWAGRVLAGDHEIEARGLFVRDHTWGQRQYSQLSSAWWYPSCFDDGACYLGGALVRYGDRSGGYAIIADADGVEGSTEVALRVADGREDPCGYSTTVLDVRFPERGDVSIASTTITHLPHYFPGFADRYYTNDAFSTLTLGGRRGFGVREVNSYLTEAEAAALDAVAHS